MNGTKRALLLLLALGVLGACLLLTRLPGAERLLHPLGAAGAIEAAFTLLAMREGFLPPNINFQTPDPAAAVQVVANQSREARARRALSNSFGFGGTNATIVLEAAGT